MAMFARRFDHFKNVSCSTAKDGSLACEVTTDRGDAVCLQSLHRGAVKSWTAEASGRLAQARGTVRLAAGKAAVIEKLSAVSTSRDLAPAPCATVLAAASNVAYEALLAEHRSLWNGRWAESDVEIEGHDDSQTALRASLYHLMRSHVRGDSRVAIDAKGYAGEGYFGRFSWDTEMYLLPFFLYTDPEGAASLVRFRIGNLSTAKKNAESYGYRGARYPWESDSEGHECGALWQYRDHEVHISADVAYAIAHYAAASGAGEKFLRGEAAQALVEIAHYWADRVHWERKNAHLAGVMGPDEYAPLTSDNAYTNRLVKFAFSLALETGERLGVSKEELWRFRETADALRIPRRADGLALQSADFEKLADPDFERTWKDRSRPYAAQVEQERIYRSKNLKQADVLLLMYLLPEEFSDDEVRAAWEYYLPVTTHDSSLSAAIHSIIASRLGYAKDAWEFWLRAAFIDLDFAAEAAAEGIHIAGAGGNWLVTLSGFAGFQTALQSKTFTLNARLPTHWKRLAFPVR